MKKLLALLLVAAALTLTFTACGGGDSAEEQLEDAIDELEDLMG